MTPISIIIQNQERNHTQLIKTLPLVPLEEKIEHIENSDINRRYLFSWELINEITGRKSTQKDMIKGRNQKERLQTWYNRVQCLLGRPPEIEEDEPITQVLPPLQIKRRPFDINEFKRANKEKAVEWMKYAQKF